MNEEHKHPIWFTKREMLAIAIWLGYNHASEELEEIKNFEKEDIAKKFHIKYREFDKQGHK
jgi:hypothetical protein